MCGMAINPAALPRKTYVLRTGCTDDHIRESIMVNVPGCSH